MGPGLSAVTPAQCQALLPGVCTAARAAGAAILEHYTGSFEVFDKRDGSPVTTADLAAHRIVAAHLAALTPEVPVLSEESAWIDWAERRRWITYWLLDPLDGTREFLSRNGQFTVNIALIHDHRSILGVVDAPATGELYYAAAGCGAYRVTGDNAPCAISTRALGEPPAVALGHYSGTQVRSLLERVPERTEHRIGSSLKSCRVAEGALDLYPRGGPTHEWDTAAAQCVVEEAGGLVVDWNLQPLRYNHSADMLNPAFLIAGDAQADWAGLVAGLVADPSE